MDQRALSLRPFGTTIFSEMTALAIQHNAVNLGQGFPDFEGPAIGLKAAAERITHGPNQYAPLAGEPVLRRAVAQWSNDLNAFQAIPDTEVTITTGCTGAIAATLLGLVNPGDEVVLFEPFYDSYLACVAMSGATPKVVTMRPKHGRFTFDPDQLSAAFSSKTRLVIVNTPHNPTGTVLNRSELEQIASLCIEHDALVLSDEVYERLTYDKAHTSIATIANMRDRTIVASSLGKSFSLTGWKIGWTIAPSDLTAAIRSAHQFLVFSVPGALQIGAAALLNDARDEAAQMTNHFRAMRSKLGSALSELGFDVCEPEGSYFIMAGHQSMSAPRGLSDDIEVAKWLVEHAGVVCIPPSAFYTNQDEGAPFVRFAFCKRSETIDDAIDRLRACLG